MSEVPVPGTSQDCSVGYAHLPALALLIGFGSAQCHGQAVLAEAAILNVQANSSERRNAPAKPSKISARSRKPIRPQSALPTIPRMSSVRAGAFCIAAVPSVRLIPFRVFLTMPVALVLPPG